MTKRGKLSKIEEMAILGGLNSGHSVEEIAKQLDRTPKVVQNYIDRNINIDNSKKEEHSRFATPTKHDISKAHSKHIIVDDIVSKDVIDITVNRFRQEGLTENDINKIIHLVLQHATDKNWKFKGHNASDKFYTACLKKMKAGHFIQKVTQGGNEGVAIMSPAASQRTDEAKKNYQKANSRSFRGNIYNPKTKEIE